MSKTLATIETHAEIEFDVEKAHLGDLYTKEAHDLFQRLQFKNLLGRFDVGVSANEVEKKFREVTEREEIERVFEEAMHAESGGGVFEGPGKCSSAVRASLRFRSDRGRLR